MANIHKVFFTLACAWTAVAQPSGVLGVLSEELDRNFRGLKEKADPAPYFLSYEVTEHEFKSVTGSLGTLDSTNGGKSRTMDVSIRVGDRKLDNYHRDRGSSEQVTGGATISFEDNVPSVKRRLWLALLPRPECLTPEPDAFPIAGQHLGGMSCES